MQLQVMLRWELEQGVTVLPKSYNPDRIFSNFQILDWSLTSDDHEKIGVLKQVKLFRGILLLTAQPAPTRLLKNFGMERFSS